MSLTLVVGRPNSGKTGTLWGVVRHSVAEGRSPMVVLPSTPDAEHAAQEFARHGPRLGVSAIALDDYIDDLWAEHGDGRRIVGNTERSLALARAAQACELDELERSARRGGFAELLKPLAANGVDRLALPAKGPRVVVEIVEVLLEYRRMLANARMIERADAVDVLAATTSPSWLAEPVVANRFADLTPLQERFLVSAASHTDVWLALPWQEGFAATRALDRVVERLVGNGAVLVKESPRQYTESEELRYVESHLFTRPASVLETPRRDDVRLSLAHGEEAEAQRIVCEVQNALGEGVPADKIAVVFEDASEHAPWLRSAFIEAGIEADIDLMRPARETGWGRALALLTSFCVGGARSDLVAFLRTPYAGVTHDDAERIDALWRRSRAERPERLFASLRDENAQASALVRLAGSLLDRGAAESGDVRNWKVLADRLMQNAYGGSGPRLDVEGLADASAHRAFLRLVTTVADTFASHANGREIVDAFLGSSVAVSVQTRAESVRVMSASRARSQRLQVVIIGGLTAGDFPRPAAENPLAAPEVASALRQAGVEVPLRDEQEIARLTFYLVASRASKRLVLSRQVAASDGSEVRSSWLLEELLDLYRRPEAEDEDDALMPPRTVLRFDEQGLSEAAPRSRRRELREAAIAQDASGIGGGDPLLGVAFGRAVPRHALLEDDRALAELSDRHVFSATEVESYLRCPYGWFRGRIVRAQALDPDEEVIERGRLCHEALRRVYAAMPQAIDAKRVTAHNLRQVLALANDVLRQLLDEQGDTSSLSGISTAASVRRRVLGFLQADSTFLPGFEPLGLEYEFQPGTCAFEGFELRGRMDRVDRGPRGELVVTDYKTGTVGSTHSATKFESRGLVQLTLYARIAQTALGAPVVAALYRGVSGQNVSGKQNRGFYTQELAGATGLVGTDLMTGDEIAHIVSNGERRAAEAVDRMRRGLIPAEPLDEKSCKTCAFAVTCPGVRR